MAQPLPYERDFDFAGFQSTHPSTPLPGDKVNLELDQIAETFDQIRERIRILQRDDLQLANQSVGWDQLKPELRNGFSTPTVWAVGVDYALGAAVYVGRKVYAALVAHKSVNFGVDLAAGRWYLLADFTAVTQVDQTAVEAAQQAIAAATAANSSALAAAQTVAQSAANAQAAQNSATAAAASQNAAAASASVAAVSATNAAASASSAATYATNAAQSADTAFSAGAIAGAEAATNLIIAKTGAPNGLAALDSTGNVPLNQLENVPVGADPVADRVALKALNVNEKKVAILGNEGGRNGIFVFNIGDLSALVANDAQEGMYIAPASDPTGASGAWVRQRSGLDLNVLWFGAIASSTNAYAAINTLAFNAAANLFSIAKILIPTGEYRLNGPVTWNGSSISWQGDGAKVSIVVFTSDANGFDAGASAPVGYTRIQDFSIRTTATAAMRSAFSVKLDPIIRGNFEACRMDIRGVNTNDSWWGVGIDVTDGLIIQMDRIDYMGRSGTLSATFSTTIAAIRCRSTVSTAMLSFTHVTTINANRGIWIVGTVGSQEGVLVDKCGFVTGNYGVVVDFSAMASNFRSPHVSITNTHAEVSLIPIDIKKARQVFITGNLLYQYPGEDLNETMVRLTNVDIFTVSGNQMEKRNGAIGGAVSIIDCTNGFVESNFFQDFPDYCVQMSGTTANCTERNNRKTTGGPGMFFDGSSNANTNKGGVLAAQTGWRWDGDVLVQWGRYTATTDATGLMTIPFTRPFPNAAFSINVTPLGSALGVAAGVPSLTGCDVVIASSATVSRTVQYEVRGN